MAEVLVVEDSPDQSALIAALLESGGYSVRLAEGGAAALAEINRSRPDLVITDLVMPEMDGLQLVESVRGVHPDLPVILVTAFGSAEIAVAALKKGAANYVPKVRLSEDLLTTAASVLALARERRQKAQLLESLVESEFRFVMPNDEVLIPGLVEFLQDRMIYRHPHCDENVLMQVGIAVQEAVRNAMHHGNLEVSSDLRQESVARYDAKVQERLQEMPYAKRRVTVEARFVGKKFLCKVADQGPGFDPSSVPDPTDPDNILKTSGRGIYLISTFMDKVDYNETGTEVVMAKNLDDCDSAESENE